MARSATFVSEEFTGKVVELFSTYPAIDGSMLGLRFQMDGTTADDFRIAVPRELLVHFADALLHAITVTQENFERHGSQSSGLGGGQHGTK